MQAMKPRWRLCRVGAALSAMLFAVGGVTGVSADSSNVENVQQSGAEIVGNAAGGIAGPALTFDTAVVNQINVQVIAGDQETQDNSSQTAYNEANIDQTNIAVSGDASASDGGTAMSGRAIAGSFAHVLQLNVQVIAGFGCAVTQEASNVVDLDQEAVALSGDASATGGSATTGDASARNSAHIQQRNIQIYHCHEGSAGSQVANNVADYDQTVAAATGNATSTAGGDSSTGDALSESDVRLNQSNFQLAGD